VQKLQDYTFREQEIAEQRRKAVGWAPRRLRGQATKLVQKIFRNHTVCSYSQLLRHYCPLASAVQQPPAVQPRKTTLPVSGSEPLVTQNPLSWSPYRGPATPSDVYNGDTSFLAHASPT